MYICIFVKDLYFRWKNKMENTQQASMSKKDYAFGIIAGLLIGLLMLPIVKAAKPELYTRFAIIILPFFLIGTPVGLVVAKLISRKISIVWQIGKFGVIGVLNTLVDIGSLALITFLLRSTADIDPKKELLVISGVAITIYSIYKAITFIIANVNSYFWNKYWTFEQGAAKKTRAQFFQFFIVSIIGFIINVLVASIVYKSLDVLLPGTTDDQKGLLAAAAGSVLGMAWNFIGYKFIVFKE